MKTIIEHDGLTLKLTGNEYDFFAILENNNDGAYFVDVDFDDNDFEPGSMVEVPEHDWIGFTCDDEGRALFEAVEQSLAIAAGL